MSGTVNYNYLAQDTTKSPQDYITGWQNVQKNQLDIQNQQAQVEQGKALQQAIDPNTGQFDQAKYNQLLATNPMAARGAAAAAQAGVTLDTDTYKLHSTRLNNANSAMAQLLADYPDGVPADAMHAAIERQHALGRLTDQEAAAEHAQVSADPKANNRMLLQGLGAGMSMKDQLDAVQPPIGTQDVGGRIVTTRTSPQAGSGGGPPKLAVGGGVTTGPPPGTVLETGQWVADGKGGRIWQPGHVPATAVAPPGGAPVQAPSSGSAPGTSNAPPPPPPGSTIRSPGAYQGQRSDIPPSNQVASADNSFVPSSVFLGATSTAPAAAPSGAVAGDVTAIQAGRAGAQATPSTGTQTAQNYPPAGTPLSPSVVQTPQGPFLPSGPPSGYNETLNNDIKAHTDASMAAGDQRKNLQAGENAFEALRMAGNYTGAGTGTAASLYSWLQARAPQWVIPQGEMTDTAWRQVLAKNLLRFAQESGLRMNTDLGMSEALKGTANADTILPSANREILINDIGNARQRLAQTLLMPSPSGDGTVVKHFQNYTSDTDQRAFAWDLRSAAERTAIEDEVAKDKSGKAEKRLDKGLEDAAKLGLIKLPGQRSEAAPAPGGGGPVAAPSPVAGAPANALAMAAPAQTNALAA